MSLKYVNAESKSQHEQSQQGKELMKNHHWFVNLVRLRQTQTQTELKPD